MPESDTDFRSSLLTLTSHRRVVEERKSLAAPFARVWLRVFTAKTLRWAQFSARCFVSAQILSDCQVKSGSATNSYGKIKYTVIQSTAVGLMNARKDSENKTKFKIFYFKAIFINYIVMCTKKYSRKNRTGHNDHILRNK